MKKLENHQIIILGVIIFAFCSSLIVLCITSIISTQAAPPKKVKKGDTLIIAERGDYLDVNLYHGQKLKSNEHLIIYK